jgi:hypothetical protein
MCCLLRVPLRTDVVSAVGNVLSLIASENSGNVLSQLSPGTLSLLCRQEPFVDYYLFDS